MKQEGRNAGKEPEGGKKAIESSPETAGCYNAARKAGESFTQAEGIFPVREGREKGGNQAKSEKTKR